jgi:hypothetical protein
MGDVELTFDDFLSVLKDIGGRFPSLKHDDLFVMWFLRSYITDSEERAAEAVAGGARDKGIDAVFIDDGARAVIVVQGKYRKSLGSILEKRADLIALAEVAHRLSESEDDKFKKFLKNAESLVAKRLTEARDRVKEQLSRVALFCDFGKSEQGCVL